MKEHYINIIKSNSEVVQRNSKSYSLRVLDANGNVIETIEKCHSVACDEKGHFYDCGCALPDAVTSSFGVGHYR